MNAWDELVERCARHRREKIGPLSDQAYDELLIVVREHPIEYVDTPADQAFLELARALDAYRAARREAEDLDDDAFEAARSRALATLRLACDHAARVDEGCLDARLVGLLAAEEDPDSLLKGLLDLELATDGRGAGNLEGAWEDVFRRPRLRLRAAVARTCAEGARFKMAESAAASVIDAAPSDPLGARHTAMLACARLEDEAGLGELEARFSGRESAWSHLARVLLLYKLDRTAAARRALRGFDDLCAGGAYALLRPSYVDPYLPDRPEAEPRGFEEGLLAVHEAEPIIADVPEFVDWCQGHDWFVASARRFAERNDLDW
ncbi:hypothetical protein [Thermophilibacter sp.]